MDEVTDEPLYRDRVCGIDIGKAGMAATIRVPSDKNPARRAQETREFGTTKREVLALADWLRCWQVPAVVMEATGDYWKPVFYRLEAEGFECVLADARQVKNLPGRPKRDPSDSRWLAACFERGSVTGCFVATPEFRLIREHTRYRRDLTGDRTREKQRAEKLLESAAIKISSVITNLHGMTGRDIMDHLIAGERDPRVLAELARGKARPKIGRLAEALRGRVGHGESVGAAMAFEVVHVHGAYHAAHRNRRRSDAGAAIDEAVLYRHQSSVGGQCHVDTVPAKPEDPDFRRSAPSRPTEYRVPSAPPPLVPSKSRLRRITVSVGPALMVMPLPPPTRTPAIFGPPSNVIAFEMVIAPKPPRSKASISPPAAVAA